MNFLPFNFRIPALAFPEQWRSPQLISCLLIAAACLLGSSALAQTNAESARLILQVEGFESESLSPPSDDAEWETMDLPLVTRFGDEEHIDRVLWLRFKLDKPADNIPHSLYFYRYNLSIDVYFNGQRIGGDSYRPNRQTVAWNHPRIVDIQNANWQDTGNEVHVHFVGSYFGGTFGPMLFGPQAQLQELYEVRSFRQIRVNEWLQASGILVTLLAMSLWIMRRHDPVYLLFSALTASWLVLQTHMVVYYNLIEYRYWLPLVHIAIDLFILFMFLFLTRFARMPSPRSERALLCWTTLAVLWHIFAPVTVWWMGAYTVHGIGNLFMLTLLARIGVRAVRDRDLLSVIIGITVIIQFTLAVHDWLLIMTGDMEDWESAMYLSQFAFPLLLLVFTIGLLNRFVSALNTAEELNRTLERKVEASRKMIEASFAEQRALELSRAAEEERVKIYRDLHDDVGSKLLSIVHAGRDHKLGELARTALRSLREAVSRANSPQQNLAEFLAALREESKLRLEGTGHQVDWLQADELPALILESEQVYNLNRICREIVSNVIRHAQATHISIQVEVTENSWQLCFVDNGIGMQSEATMGNGLRHIKERAAAINCSVEWNNHPERGMQTCLQLPIEHSHSAATLPIES
jgi:signal transduction histidine kinase